MVDGSGPCLQALQQYPMHFSCPPYVLHVLSIAFLNLIAVEEYEATVHALPPSQRCFLIHMSKYFPRYPLLNTNNVRPLTPVRLSFTPIQNSG